LILIENDEIFLCLRDRYGIRHLCRGSIEMRLSPRYLTLASSYLGFQRIVA
jgi:hypothetical protein